MVAGTTFIVLAVVGACVIRANYLNHEEQSEVAEAQHFLANGDYAGAVKRATQAIELNSSDLQACMVLVNASSLGHLPTELYWAQRLAEIAPTTENKLRLAATGLRCQIAPFPVTSGVLAHFTDGDTNNPAFQIVAGNFAVALHQPSDAESHFKTALQLEPNNQQYALSLATLQLGLSDPAVQKQARQRLEKLAQDGSVGITALRVLVADRQAAGDDLAAEHYSDQLLASPQASMTDRLQNLAILQQADHAKFTDRLHLVMDLAANQVSTMAELSSWMQANGLAQENVDWLGSLPRNIRSEQAYKLALAQGYLQLGKWQDVLDFANRDNWFDQDFLRLALVSRAWSQLGVPTVAQSDWGEAVKKAGDHYEAMTNLLVLAQHWQMSDAQQDLRQRILQVAPQ